MRCYSRIWFGACAVILCATVLVAFAGQGQSNPDTFLPETSLLASEAYTVLSELPKVGIDQSKGKLEGLIASANKLLAENDPQKTQLSLALREAIAHGLVYEMYRSEAIRLGIGLEGQPVLIPFQKENFLDLWNASMPNDVQILNRTRRGHDVIVDALSSNSVDEAELVSGKQLDQMSQELRNRFAKLRHQAKDYSLQGKELSADEQFVQSLVVLQSLQDLDVIVRVYEQSGLLKDRADFRAAIDVALQGMHKKRMDDGMRASSLKVLSTFSKYCSPSESAYLMQQAMLLGPYMKNTEKLPAQVQTHLGHQKKAVESSKSAGKKK
ncbi:MAG: hypothetical protein ACOX52_09145 [Verrucomicrobiota bacterium]|jgi:hypothetical protein